MPVYTLTTLASFSGSNGSFPSDLIIDSAGDLYGTTYSGGPTAGRSSSSFRAPAPW